MISTTKQGGSGYTVTPNISRKEWEKGRKYTLLETTDSEGDILWILTGPGVDVCTYDKGLVDRELMARGVTVGVRRWDYASSWEVNPHGVATADFD